MSDIDNPDNNAPDSKPGDGAPDGAPDINAFKPITSQEDLDALISKRIARVEKKYEGFDELKEKAAKFETVETEKMSEIEKAVRRAEKAERERDDFKTKLSAADRRDLVRDIADELGLPKKLASRVQGDSEDDIRADIKDLLSGLPSTESGESKNGKQEKEPPSQSPKHKKISFTASGDEADQGLEVSADDILKEVGRGVGA